MRTRRHAATIEDVARLAGVSIATVSRVMNQRGSPSRGVTARVTAAVSELGYAPRAAAQGLKARRALAVGVVVPSLQVPAFARFVEILETALAAQGYTVLVQCSHEDPLRELAAARRLLGIGIDAVVLVGAYQNAELVGLLAHHRVPAVRTFTIAQADDIPSIGFDNYRAAFDLTTYLLDLGHRRFGVLSGVTRSNDRAAARLSGVRDAMAAQGVAWPSDACHELPLRIAEGQGAMRELLSRRVRPTAVVCTSDLLAFGAVTQARREGLRIPEDVSIAGFDDFDFAAYFADPLTTVHVPVAEMAEATARSVLDGFAGDTTMRSAELACSLIVRASTAPPQ